MEQLFNILSDLKVRFIKNLLPTTNDRTPTAVFQFVNKDTNNIVVQVDANCRFQFEVLYQHRRNFYIHPYILRMNDTQSIESNQQITYNIELYLELKRLRDFEIDDLRRYYQSIDENIDTDEELHDFHDVYLILNYQINGQSGQYQCNKGQPINLPKIISNPWKHEDTLIRFRYDAENREGTFPCQMTFNCEHIMNLQWYKIVICLTSNTIPPQMDYHAIRWIYKVKPKICQKNGSSNRQIKKEITYSLHHASGVVVAQVFGPKMKFISNMLQSKNHTNYVKSCFEPKGFENDLENSDNDNSKTGALAIALIKGTDYPKHLKSRCNDRNILPYIPFNELEDIDKNFQENDKEIAKLVQCHKKQRDKQLTLFDENEKGTYSQAHVRLYVAAYDENDNLLTEALHPPLRNSKIYKQLNIIRIVQPKHELQANEPAYVYCIYDYGESKSESDACPYEFELAFTSSLNIQPAGSLLQLFERQKNFVRASYVTNCHCLLQFKVPEKPEYNEHRIFIRLRDSQSKDYDPSEIALNGKECWIYHAFPPSTTNKNSTIDISDIDNSLLIDPTESFLDYELHTGPENPSIILQDSTSGSENGNHDTDHSDGELNTPDDISRRFRFPNHSSPNDDDE